MSDYEVVTQHNVCIRTSRFTFTTPITRTPHAKLTTHSTFDFAHTSEHVKARATHYRTAMGIQTATD